MFFPFNLKIGAQLTTYAGVILAVSAAAAWLREDAKKDAMVEIHAAYERKNVELKEEVARRVKKAEDLQRILETTEKEAASLLAARDALLEKQRDAVPLSEACNACRVPNDRLWLRPGTKGPATSVKGSGGS